MTLYFARDASPFLPWLLRWPRIILPPMEPDVREYLDKLTAMMAREFARINDRFDGVDARLEVIDARLEGHDRRLDNLEAHVHDLRREVKSGFVSVHQSIGALTLRVEALEQARS
jgi:hypothetical protein